MKCVFWFFLQRLCKTFLMLNRTERDVIINLQMYSYKIRTNERSDMTKLIVAFRNFANALKTYFLVD
jgi:hypothetical protein